MTSSPPKIDYRSYDDIVEQTTKLAQDYTAWTPASDGKPDAGKALIRIFGRMAKIVSDRLNQVPEKNFLAFLDLIGGKLIPPHPAKVPLTFYLAEGSPVDGLVLAYTQVSAPPTEGETEEIIFETDRELVVTTTQLKAVFVREPERDLYSDRTSIVTENEGQSCLVFTGDLPIAHHLYITCPEIFNLPSLSTLTLTIDTNNAQNATQLSLNWYYWDGSQWQNLPNPNSTTNQNQWILTFNNFTIPAAGEINGKTGKWLQARLNSLPANLVTISQIQSRTTINQTNLLPEICLFNSSPLDLSQEFYPFGEQSQLYDTFYIALNRDFVKPNGIVTLNFDFSHQPINIEAANLQITWEIGNDEQWQAINWVENSSAIKFTETAGISQQAKFQLPQPLPSLSTVDGETCYWIRARITQGFYGKSAQQRQYPIYNDVALLTVALAKGSTTITVDNIDLLAKGDSIRLQPNTGGFPEEHKITDIQSGNQLILDSAILNDNLGIGTRILRKSIIVETIPAIYDSPAIKSLSLSYNFTLQESAVYTAYNDFTYFQSQPVTTSLKTKAAIGDKLLKLTDTQNLAVGEFLTLGAENYQIATINPRINQVSLVSKINSNYPENSLINRYFYPFTPTVDQNPSFYLGFNGSFSNKTVTLYIQVAPPLSSELSEDVFSHQPQLFWEYFSPLGWQFLGIQDETKGFSQRGLIQFIAPVDFLPVEIFGQKLYWLRVRWQGGDFRIQPRLQRILTNTTWAIQATTLRGEILGSSNNEPNQVFYTSYSPVLIGQELQVQEGQITEDWVTWQEVPDFYSSDASDRHYILDHLTGKISFGDGQMGMAPPRVINNIRLSNYRTGGGSRGNIAAQTINELKTTIPYIDRVINLEPASGGSAQENLERLQQRVPKQLRHRNRAVTLADIEDLAYEASTDVARVKLITPDLIASHYSAFDEKFWLDPAQPGISFPDNLTSKLAHIANPTERANFEQMINQVNDFGGQVKLIVLPNSKDRQPIPSLTLLEEVEAYIRDRCEVTLNFIATSPEWQEVIVTAAITPSSLQGIDLLRNTINQRLEAFLHPLTGGKGTGWRFGRYPQKSDLYALIQSISGVDRVDTLTISPDPTTAILSADTLIFSGVHTINITSTGGQN